MVLNMCEKIVKIHVNHIRASDRNQRSRQTWGARRSCVAIFRGPPRDCSWIVDTNPARAGGRLPHPESAPLRAATQLPATSISPIPRGTGVGVVHHMGHVMSQKRLALGRASRAIRSAGFVRARTTAIPLAATPVAAYAVFELEATVMRAACPASAASSRTARSCCCC